MAINKIQGVWNTKTIQTNRFTLKIVDNTYPPMHPNKHQMFKKTYKQNQKRGQILENNKDKDSIGEGKILIGRSANNKNMKKIDGKNCWPMHKLKLD